MKPIRDFIVKPLGDIYANSIELGDKKLILNSNIENHKFVNRLAVVIETPSLFKTIIKKGSVVVIHHNVFRRFYDIRGNEKNSRSYLMEDKYLVSIDQVFMFVKDNELKAFGDRCFVKPIKSSSEKTTDSLHYRKGILLYDNDSLNNLNVFSGDIVNYKKMREFEFYINNELLYCMKSNDILINYGNKNHKEKNNRSWS